MRPGNVCEYCGKGYQKGHLVSHAKNRSIRRFKANLHVHFVVEKGKVLRRRLCTSCLRKITRPTRKATTRPKLRPLATKISK